MLDGCTAGLTSASAASLLRLRCVSRHFFTSLYFTPVPPQCLCCRSLSFSTNTTPAWNLLSHGNARKPLAPGPSPLPPYSSEGSTYFSDEVPRPIHPSSLVHARIRKLCCWPQRDGLSLRVQALS